MRWLMDHKAALPSIAALVAVAALWILGAVGGIAFLAGAGSPTTLLIGLYALLVGVALSSIIATLALNDLLSRYSRPRIRR